MRSTVAVALLLTGCGVGDSDMKRLMRQEGITEFVDKGYAVFGCSDSDAFHSEFTGKKNGVPVSGYVCGGLSKGYTVRYK